MQVVNTVKNTFDQSLTWVNTNFNIIYLLIGLILMIAIFSNKWTLKNLRVPSVQIPSIEVPSDFVSINVPDVLPDIQNPNIRMNVQFAESEEELEHEPVESVDSVALNTRSNPLFNGGSVVTGVTTLAKQIVDKSGRVIGSVVGSLMNMKGGIIDSVGNVISTGGKIVARIVGNIVSLVGGIITKLGSIVIQGNVVGYIVDTVSDVVANIRNIDGKTVCLVVGNVTDLIGSVINNVGNIVNRFGKIVGRILGSVRGLIGSIIDNSGDIVSDTGEVVGCLVDVANSQIRKVQLCKK